MAWGNLMQALQGYQQQIPEYLQRFFGEYSASPYNQTVLNEVQRRSQDSLGRNLGQVASYYGGAGRAGSGLMGRAMSDATAENMQRERGDMAGLLTADRNQWFANQLGAAGQMAGLQGAGMGATAQGYGADQARAAQQYAANQSRIASMYGADRSLDAARLAANASRYNTDAYNRIGMGNLGMNRYFGNWDRLYRQDMMPYQQMNMLGQGLGSLLGNFGTNMSGGNSYGYGPVPDPWLGFLQGGTGGAMTGYGLWGGNGGGGGSPYSWGMA